MDVFEQALLFAAEKHRDQFRKDKKTPYIVHPLEAASVAAALTSDKEILAAALLHDVVEDAGVKPEELKEKFGERVTELVLSETEDKRNDRPPAETWQIRKAESLEVLKSTDDIGVKILWLSDKLSNVRSFYRQYCECGSAFWQNFHQSDPKMQEWYYRTVLENISELSESVPYRELYSLVDKLFESKD